MDEYEAWRRQRAHAQARLSRLTERQLRTAVYMARGYSLKETAARLEITTKAVESRRTSIKERLECNSQYEVVVWVVKAGLLDAEVGR